jgi:ABC-type transport system involved in cytochrome bd biosynthesis fused ATPase/permease subunit
MKGEKNIMKLIYPSGSASPKKATTEKLTLNRAKEILYDHDVAKMPQEVVHRKNVILTTEIITTAFLDLLSLSIKGAQSALLHNMNVLAFMLIILYFVREVLRSSVQTFTDVQKTSFNGQSDSYITENVSSIANAVRGKVFRKKNNEPHNTLMTNAEIIINMKEYISFVWTFWQKLPVAIADGITAVVLAVAILVAEFLQTKDLKLTLVFSGILIMCIILFAILYKLRINVRKKYRTVNKELRKENEVAYNDVKHIEPLIKKEFTYRVSLLVANLKKTRSNERKEDFSLNILAILRSIILAIFMIIIIFIKVVYNGTGISGLDLAAITDILAISSVYSTILDKIATLLRSSEDILNTLKDAEIAKIDVDNIMTVYDLEKNKVISHENVDYIQVNPFSFSYPGAMSVYNLVNTTTFTLEKGKAYLAYGETGCGKSTFMHLICGKIFMDESPISYGTDCKRAYLSSIMFESDGMLGSNSILNEITFGEEVIRTKLVHILKGTLLYNDILRNLGLKNSDDDKVIEYLESTTAKQYSQGQKQRISICKVLYNLTQDHQIVVFDEATNALDNATTKSVLEFITTYCQSDVSRIVLFVSHQVEITSEIADGSLTFEQNHFPSFEIKTHL